MRGKTNKKGTYFDFVGISRYNHDLIKEHYLENHRKNVAAKAAAEEIRKQWLELIEEGTQFVMATYRCLTIEE